MASGFTQCVEQSRYVFGIVLAIAIHADHIFVAQLVGQFVSGLEASAQSQVVGQAEDVSTRGSCAEFRAVRGCVIDNQNGGFWKHASDFVDDAGNRAHLIKRGDQNQELMGSNGRLHRAATRRGLME